LDSGADAGGDVDAAAFDAGGDAGGGADAPDMADVRDAAPAAPDAPAPTCSDGVTNAQETDVDCGGPDCARCGLGGSCGENGDCTSGVCLDGSCVAHAHSCLELLQTGVSTDGDHVIDVDGPEGPLPPFAVFCDMTTDGGGFTLLEPCDALDHLDGTLVAVEAAPTEGIDTSCRPYTQDAAGAHTYHYTFSFPPGFSAFYLADYTMKANAASGDTSDISPGTFVQSSWNTGYLSAHGDVSFGSAEAMGPATSYAAQGTTVGCERCITDWPADRSVVVLPADATSFRIGWGEAGSQAEGWYPWWGGTIALR